MGNDDDIAASAARLERLLAERLGLRQGDLRGRLARAGRHLPRGIRSEAARVADALHLSGHPKLRHQIDRARVARAADAVQRHLKGIDPRDRRKGAVLGALGGLAANMLLAFALLMAVLAWRGFL